MDPSASVIIGGWIEMGGHFIGLRGEVRQDPMCLRKRARPVMTGRGYVPSKRLNRGESHSSECITQQGKGIGQSLKGAIGENLVFQ